jgi:hypothetical protein
MAGNEIYIAKYLIENLHKLKLNHIGLVKEIGAPTFMGGYKNVQSVEELKLISTEGAEKKADIYINGKGVSLKQSGANFLFNRLQRAELLDVFKSLNFPNPEAKLELIDSEVDLFHNGIIQKRNRPWQKMFNEDDFKLLLKFLMTEGSPNLGVSAHPAEFIAEAPNAGISEENINVYTFDEYFNLFKNNIFIALRRQWIGQSSKSEHNRALGLSKKEGNQRWVYKSISGEPRISKTSGTKWRADIPENERRTVYIIFVEKT